MTKESHRNQRHFRTIMEALSFPGKIVPIDVSSQYRGEVFDSSVELLQVLLDGEVGLCVLEEEGTSFEEIAIRTNCKKASIEDADFLLLPLAHLDQAKDLFHKVKKGTLINPHTSASLFIEVEKLQEEKDLLLTGPGIKEKRALSIQPAPFWLESRNEVVKDFPLGVDVFLIDQESRLVALPRTTKIKVGE